MPPQDFLLPHLPGGTATVLAWLVQPGTLLAPGTPMALLLTACAELVLPAPYAGTLAEPVKPGTVVAPGDLLARLAPVSEPEPRPTPPEARLRATPLARAIARRHGFDLIALAGSGSRSQIRAANVRALLNATAQTPDIAVLASSAPMPRRLMPGAERLTMPIASATIEFDASAALEHLITAGAACARRSLPLSLTTIVVEAVTALLPSHALLNACWAGEAVLLRRRHHIAVGEPGPDGLRWALIRDASDLTLPGLARAMLALDQDRDAATFAVVRLANGSGWLGAQPPLADTTAALSLSVPIARPVVRAGAMIIRPMAALTLSYDARLLDHGDAIAFLQPLRDRLERKRQATPAPPQATWSRA